MANFSLPAASSVVDFLNTQGKDSSFGARKKIYQDAGLNGRLGDFQGSSSQNMALLDHLKGTVAPPSPTPGATGVLASANTTTPARAPAFSPLSVPPANKGPVNFGAISFVPPAGIKATDVLGKAKPPVDFSAIGFKDIPGYGGSDVTATKVAQTPAPSNPAPSADGSASGTKTTITTDTIIPGGNATGEHDYVNEFLNSQEGQSLMDKQNRGELDAEEANAEAKRLLENKYATDRSTLESNLAQNGLAFSGIRNTQLKSLIDNLGASELNLDRTLASKLLDSNATLRDGILKGVGELIKAAADKDKEAIQQLNQVGLAVVDGKVVPTLASRNADRAAAQQEVANARAQQNFQLQEQRLAISERAASRAEARFQQLYGAGKKDFFKAITMLINQSGDATPEDIKLAIRSNPDVFGSPSEAELKDAMSLVGIPTARQTEIATSVVGSLLDVPFNIPFLGKSGAQLKEQALADAKAKARQAIIDSKGSIDGTDASGNKFSYELNSDQVHALLQHIDGVTLEEAQAAK